MTTLALVGYGYWGPNLLRNYMELPDVDLKTVCDLRPEILHKAKTRYPTVQVTTDYQSVLADREVEAVVIATPISTHYSLARAAVMAGKHVFVEKPLTNSSREAGRLVELAATRGLVLMVGHTFVYSPPVMKVKEILSSGQLGDVRFVTSSRVNLGLHQKDASVVWDLVPHDLSILDYWLGEQPETVSVTGRGCIRPDMPDVAFVNLRFPSGIVALVEVAWLSPVKLRRTIVVGSKRMLLYDDIEPVEKIKVFDHGVEFKDPDTFGEFQLSYRTGDIVSPKIDASEPLRVEATHFLSCIASGDCPITDGAAGLRVVRSLEAAERSLRSGGVTQRLRLPSTSPARRERSSLAA
jgi:predicted dehydrogenase